ncbi:protein RUFY3 isoform X2 [Folsomia candida]|uniref:protein RUFY3 isoform X2 n=1 Tax=Folsomia candida TaxID=158441 RepID=UPI001605540D|nr:protein RUFY3 isoform X2 [Folsomia candida]
MKEDSNVEGKQSNQDTIYLCNFRVSVDGDWLCLRQLDDVEVPLNNRHSLHSPEYINTALYESCLRDPTHVERQNLLNITKLVIKELIEWSLRHGRNLEPEHPPLLHFFIVLEHAMRHGLKPKKGLLGPKKELWDVLQLVEKYTNGAEDITNSIRDLPTVSTHLGRGRAFMRLALMQKKLADYFKVLVDVREEVLLEFYEPFALMMSEEAVILSGLLVGLNVIDCNFCLKEEDLDSAQGVIDFSLYLRSSRSSESGGEVGEPDKDIDNMLDQKNYIEELNRHLNATVANLQSRTETLTTTNALLSEDLTRAKNVIASLQAENKKIKSESQENLGGSNSTASSEKNFSADKDPSVITALEKENESLKCKNKEMEEAMKLMEKDVHEKQDTVISLRKQLDDIKSINLEMYKKLQECEATVKFKTELCDKLEEKVNRSDQTVRLIEEKMSNANTELRLAQKDSRSVCMKLAEKELQLSTTEGDLRVEREWRITLQETTLKDKSKISDLMQKLLEEKSRNRDSAASLEMAGKEMDSLRRQVRDQEQTLEEMGIKVAESKLLADEMREAGGLLKWKSDKEFSHCKSCAKEFSLTRRKHHCRSCGEIFCGQCSDNVMELASSSKAVRVCDTCYGKGLVRFNTTNSSSGPSVLDK